MPGFLAAGLWGLVGGSALLIGAAVGYAFKLPQRLIAAIMAVGSGVLISAVAFDLMDEAYARGGFDSTGIGFLPGHLLIPLPISLCRGRGQSTASGPGPTRNDRRLRRMVVLGSPSPSERCWTAFRSL